MTIVLAASAYWRRAACAFIDFVDSAQVSKTSGYAKKSIRFAEQFLSPWGSKLGLVKRKLVVTELMCLTNGLRFEYPLRLN